MNLTKYERRPSREVRIGRVVIGGDRPIAVQSMTNTDTKDTEACIRQIERIFRAGGPIVRLTAQGRREGENLERIVRRLREEGCDAAVVADIHFVPEVAAIAERVSGVGQFVDRRDEADRSTFWAFSLFIYGFLAIIALITVLNIVNSISMSVTARTREYGAMRAVGMDGSQLTRMIAAEAATYAVSGSLCGIALGLPLHRLLYERLITAHFPYYSWELPTAALSIIVCFILKKLNGLFRSAGRQYSAGYV